jgi:hypothetical protein
MDSMDAKALLKKLHSLNDLRSAISEVKNLSKDAKVLPMPGAAPAAPAQNDRAQAGQALENSRTGLKHLGVKHTASGTMTHMVGLPGAHQHYEINMNMHNAAQKKPAFTISHVDSGSGDMKSQHPMAHDSISSAVSALVHHAHTGEWK